MLTDIEMSCHCTLCHSHNALTKVILLLSEWASVQQIQKKAQPNAEQNLIASRKMTVTPHISELVVASWNSRGSGKDRLRYLHKLTTRCHVVFVQEHWLFDFELHKLTQGLNNTSLIGVSGMDQTQVLVGRPYGGCAILYDDRMNCKCEIVVCVSKRICACILQWPNSVRILFINAYMPFESGDAHSLNEFIHVLHEVRDIVQLNHNVDRVIFGGDLNCDLKRLGGRVRALRELCVSLSADFCAEQPVNTAEYTYRNDATRVLFLSSTILFSLRI